MLLHPRSYRTTDCDLCVPQAVQFIEYDPGAHVLVQVDGFRTQHITVLNACTKGGSQRRRVAAPVRLPVRVRLDLVPPVVRTAPGPQFPEVGLGQDHGVGNRRVIDPFAPQLRRIFTHN